MNSEVTKSVLKRHKGKCPGYKYLYRVRLSGTFMGYPKWVLLNGIIDTGEPDNRFNKLAGPIIKRGEHYGCTIDHA